MNIRFSTIVWLVVWVVAAFGLYMVKFKVQSMKTEVTEIESQLRKEKKNIHVLKAEWAYLNRPERLRQLTAKYLDSKAVHGQQFADFASFPMRKSADSPVQNASDEEETGPLGPMLKNNITLASGVTHEQ